ncbi:flotillin-like FloA family protein [Aeoliella sp.]|uniref:flotillin-like FloA family protein n=1 Tax=Aeoliella sp. TaxID=2795800 RepID=UPI003CCC0709
MSLWNALPLVAVQGGNLAVLVMVVVMLLVMVVVAATALSLMRPWLMAMMAGCSLPVMKIVGMRLRRTNVAEVVRCGVMCNQAGCPIGWNDLERAALTGADLERVTLAYIKSQQEELGYSFSDLVDADRNQRLARLLEEGR